MRSVGKGLLNRGQSRGAYSSKSYKIINECMQMTNGLNNVFASNVVPNHSSQCAISAQLDNHFVSVIPAHNYIYNI